MFDVVTKLYAEGGIRSLFRGTVATLARDGPGSAAYFATYEYLKKMLSATPEILPDGSKAPAPPLSVPAIMAAGGGAGIAMWSLGIPPDVSFFLSVSSAAIIFDTHSSFFSFCRLSNPVSRVRPRGHILASWTVPGSLSLMTA